MDQIKAMTNDLEITWKLDRKKDIYYIDDHPQHGWHKIHQSSISIKGVGCIAIIITNINNTTTLDAIQLKIWTKTIGTKSPTAQQKHWRLNDKIYKGYTLNVHESNITKDDIQLTVEIQERFITKTKWHLTITQIQEQQTDINQKEEQTTTIIKEKECETIGMNGDGVITLRRGKIGAITNHQQKFSDIMPSKEINGTINCTKDNSTKIARQIIIGNLLEDGHKHNLTHLLTILRILRINVSR